VVLYSEYINHTLPILDRFSRVLSLADLEADVLSTFVFTGLLERLVQIRDTPATLPPVPVAGLRHAFERMAIWCRREGRSAVDRYLANAVRLALDSGDAEGALQMTSLRLDFMTADEGAQLVSRLADSLGDVSRDDPSRMLTVARLAILRVKTMTAVDEAIALLEATTRRCLDPPNHRALSALATSLGWQLLLQRDTDGALQSGNRALELAAPSQADLEAARALHLIGVACHERGDLEAATRALEQASDLMPSDPFNDDRVLILLRLGDVMRASGLPIAARSVFDLALKTSEAFGFTQGLAIARARLDGKAGRRS
jgi:tetratricopeptide (TPR) repeat protein